MAQGHELMAFAPAGISALTAQDAVFENICVVLAKEVCQLAMKSPHPQLGAKRSGNAVE